MLFGPVSSLPISIISVISYFYSFYLYYYKSTVVHEPLCTFLILASVQILPILSFNSQKLAVVISRPVTLKSFLAIIELFQLKINK